MSETETVVDRLNADTLQRARALREPEVEIGTEVGFGSASIAVALHLQSDFGFDINTEPVRIEERSGIEEGVRYVKLLPTNTEGVYLQLGFSSEQKMRANTPGMWSLVRLDLKDVE